MKTLLLPKILANEKKGGLCKKPHVDVLRRNAPRPAGNLLQKVLKYPNSWVPQMAHWGV